MKCFFLDVNLDFFFFIAKILKIMCSELFIRLAAVLLKKKFIKQILVFILSLM